MTTAIPVMPDGAVSVRLLEGLRRRIGSRKMGLWFEQTAKVGVGDETVSVVVPSRFHADWITRNFAEHVTQAACDATGRTMPVRVEVNPESFGGLRSSGSCRDMSAADGVRRPARHAPGPDQECGGDGQRSWHGKPLNSLPWNGSQGVSENRGAPRPAASTVSRRRRVKPANQDEMFALEDFIVGDCNRIAYEATARFTRGDPLAPSLFVHGRCGLGKTHLLQGACRAFRAANPGAQVRYYTGEEFTNRYIAAIRSNKLSDFRRDCRGLDLLALDDVHFLSNKKATQNEFLSTFDEIGRCRARVLLASDEHPRDIMEFHQRLVTRFLAGMVVEIHPPDREMCRTLIMTMAGRFGLDLSDGAVDLLASQRLASVREIQGLLTSVRALAEFSPDARGQGTQGLIRVGVILIQKLVSASAPVLTRPVQISAIVAAVAHRFNLDVDRIMGDSRQRQVVLARSVSAYLARTLTSHSLPEIARALGRKNHTTVLAAIRRIEQGLADQAQAVCLPDSPPTSIECLIGLLTSDIRTAVSRQHASERHTAV